MTTDVLAEVARDGITESECRIAKGSLRGGLVLGLEDSGSRMHRIGRSELNYGAHRSIAHTLEQIDAVTLDEVNAVARQLLTRPVRRRGARARTVEEVAAAGRCGRSRADFADGGRTTAAVASRHAVAGRSTEP